MQRSLSLQEIRYFLEDVGVGDITSRVVEPRRIDERYGQSRVVVLPQSSSDIDCLRLEVMADANAFVFGEQVNKLNKKKDEYILSPRRTSSCTHGGFPCEHQVRL